MPGDGSDDDVAAARTMPALACYAESFGHADDAGVIAFDANDAFVGAAWIRSIRAYGFVREGVPELAIGVAPGWRGRGVGGRLMRQLLSETAAHPEISLSVRMDNPAVRLYERLGFRAIPGSEITNRVGSVSITMSLVRSEKHVE